MQKEQADFLLQNIKGEIVPKGSTYLGGFPQNSKMPALKGFIDEVLTPHCSAVINLLSFVSRMFFPVYKRN